MNHGTFLGRPMQQTQKAVIMWERVLAGLDFDRFVELGTGNGNFSVYFAMFCYQRNVQFYTFDKDPVGELSRVWDLIPGARTWAWTHDIQKQSGRDMVVDIISKPGRTILFCDNGNKIWEFLTFVPHLKAGDIVAVHDWGAEIKEQHIAPVAHLVQRTLKYLADGGHTVFFERLDVPAPVEGE